MPPQGRQRSRAKGWRLPAGGICVTRPGPLGNPFQAVIYGRARAVALHKAWLLAACAEDLGYSGAAAIALNELRARVMARLPSLRGHDLYCWCSEPNDGGRDLCHRANLLELANATAI
jgi:hypothetical protein